MVHMRALPAVIAATVLASLACSRTDSRPATAPPGNWAPASTYQGGPGAPPAGNNVQSFQGQATCAPKEVAPGVFVTFDCGQHMDVRKAIAPTFKKSFIAGPLPPFVDHRMTGLEGPVKNQGAVGTCTAVSLSTAMDHAIRKMGRGDVVSALHVWSKYAVSSMGVAGDQTEGERIALEPSWPYDPAKACKMLRQPSASGDLDPQLRAERTSADGAGRYTISAIEQLRSKPADLDEMSAVLAGGDAVWASFSVDSDAWTNGAMLAGAILPEYEQRDSAGHAVVLAGYRVVGAGKQFLIHNSWGQKWGEGGYAWISGNMVMKHLRAAYKVRISDGGGGPSPNPAPNGCPAGQAPDSVLGSCAPLCASGSAPAAGVCLPSLPGVTPGSLPAIPGMPAPGSLPFPFPIPGVTPPSQPGPAPASCPQGQVQDAVSRQCSAPCPGGAPPMGGLCLPALPR
jgi:hypothetical protein